MSTRQEWRSIDVLLLAAGLGLAAAVANVADSVARLFSFYVLEARYPLGVELKGVFAAVQLFCAFWFLWASAPLRRGLPLATRGRSWEVQPILLGLVAALVVFEVGGFGALADPYGLVAGFFWSAAFVAIAYLLWDLRSVLRHRWGRLTLWSELLLLALALVYLTGGLEFFYYWTQTLFGVVLPVWMVRVSLYAPHVLAVFALGLLWWWARERAVRAGSRPAWRDLLVSGLVGAALLVPPLLVLAGHQLPEIVIRAFVLYSLGYSSYGWPSASLLLAAVPLYVDTIAALAPGRGGRTPSMLWWLGVASLPWNGVMVLAFGYTSIPGTILAVDAVLLGAAMRSTGQQGESLN